MTVPPLICYAEQKDRCSALRNEKDATQLRGIPRDGSNKPEAEDARKPVEGHRHRKTDQAEPDEEQDAKPSAPIRHQAKNRAHHHDEQEMGRDLRKPVDDDARDGRCRRDASAVNSPRPHHIAPDGCRQRQTEEVADQDDRKSDAEAEGTVHRAQDQRPAPRGR